MKKKTGVVVPLAALFTKECPAAGDFLALKQLADFCVLSGLSVIQILPVNDTGTHSSPYSGLSAFALHPLYIRLEALPEFEAAFKNDRTFAAAYRKFQKEFKYSPRFDYNAVSSAKINILHLLYNFIEKKISSASKISEYETVRLQTEDFAKKSVGCCIRRVQKSQRLCNAGFMEIMGRFPCTHDRRTDKPALEQPCSKVKPQLFCMVPDESCTTVFRSGRIPARKGNYP